MQKPVGPINDKPKASQRLRKLQLHNQLKTDRASRRSSWPRSVWKKIRRYIYIESGSVKEVLQNDAHSKTGHVSLSNDPRDSK